MAQNQANFGLNFKVDKTGLNDLKKSLQVEIINKYEEVSPYTSFLFLNDYYKKYNLLLVVYKGQTTCFATPENYKFNL